MVLTSGKDTFNVFIGVSGTKNCKFDDQSFRNDFQRKSTTISRMENQVVTDWLEVIGGVKLVKYIGQKYAKDFEIISIFDFQETLGNKPTMKTIIEKMEMDELTKIIRLMVQRKMNNFLTRKD